MPACDVYINKSGSSHPVKKTWNGVTTQIGSIVNNEIFGSVDPYTLDLEPNGGPVCFSQLQRSESPGEW